MYAQIGGGGSQNTPYMYSTGTFDGLSDAQSTTIFQNEKASEAVIKVQYTWWSKQAVQNVKVFTNSSFRKFWNSDQRLSFDVSLPKELAEETEALRWKHGCLFMETYRDIETSVSSFYSSLRSYSYVENTLSKRHIYDYVSSEVIDLNTTVNVFSSYAILVRLKANQIGITSDINFIWSCNSDSDYNSPTISFHRFNPYDVCVDFESLEAFHTDRIIGLRIGSVQ
jgi:hypothetical protein